MSTSKPSGVPNDTLVAGTENIEDVGKILEAAEPAPKKTKAPAKTSTTRKRKAGENADASAPPEDAAGPSKPAKKTKASGTAAPSGGDISSVSLPGEEEGKVEIYDSCDELRRKIHAHIGGGTSKAAFIREIVRAAEAADYPVRIQSKQLGDFLALRGATAGNSSKVCYAAYVYFEKKRVAEGKPKSKHRVGMEGAWGAEGGLSRELRRGGYWCASGDTPTENAYGKVRIVARK
ncbi:hypothetical protein FIBSPDRAFT_869304 [Athelia psychrophila]|uniref:DUF7726 domain-containing protein n=1 Tax=Athelia psychrophila TaxID=1759441 RepID=A0A166CBB4_9AGAM|nr:hypothetical protein FIBSPDRAFT_869304 [Fibularhizoctonia sp. CBS 109695]